MRTLTLLLLGAALGGCARPPAATSGDSTPDSSRPAASRQDGPVALRRLEAEPYSLEYNSGIEDSLRAVARDDAAFAALWTRIYASHGEQPARPVLGDSMAVVAALGTRSSGGHSILVDSARVERDTLVIVVRAVAPGPNCGATAAITTPVDVALLRRLDLPVRWLERRATSDCR